MSPQDILSQKTLPAGFGQHLTMTDIATNGVVEGLKALYKKRAERKENPKPSPSVEKIEALARYMHNRSLRRNNPTQQYLG